MAIFQIQKRKRRCTFVATLRRRVGGSSVRIRGVDSDCSVPGHRHRVVSGRDLAESVMKTPGKSPKTPGKSLKASKGSIEKKRRRSEAADDRFAMASEHFADDEGLDVEELGAISQKEKKKEKGKKTPVKEAVSEEEEMMDDKEEMAGEEFDEDEEKKLNEKKQKAKRAFLAEKAKSKQNRRGVIYIGAIPPRMKPQKIRQLLTPYGKLDRIYLTPEDPSLRIKRKKFGGNTGKNFVEGWVEFIDKKKARYCAEILNNTQIGGKRRSSHYSDLWMLKYLPKFKWEHLLEEIEFQKAIREQKMQLELQVAKKERDFYLSKVEQSKQIQAMVRRREEEGGGGDGSYPEDREETAEEYELRMKKEKRERKADRDLLLRKFKQRSAVGDVNVDSDRGMMAPDVLRDLFAGSSEGPKRL